MTQTEIADCLAFEKFMAQITPRTAGGALLPPTTPSNAVSSATGFFIKGQK